MNKLEQIKKKIFMSMKIRIQALKELKSLKITYLAQAYNQACEMPCPFETELKQ